MKKEFIFILCIALNVFCLSQDTVKAGGLFEGRITYEYRIMNPNKNIIADEEFYSSMPDSGKSTFIMYVKGNKYRTEYPDRTEIYSPAYGQISVSSNNKNDSSGWLSVNTQEDPVIKLSVLPVEETIMGLACNSVEIISKWETKTFYYSPFALRTHPQFWKNHHRDFCSEYFSKANAFPLLIRRKSMLGNYEIHVIKIEKQELEDPLFSIPK